MSKKLQPLGVDDYKTIVTENYYYIDKTLLINDLLTGFASGQVILMPRPRRFGKTLNMSMLKYFFEQSEESQAHLFKDKKISQKVLALMHQGQYPVIFLTLKSAKGLSWQQAYGDFRLLIGSEYRRHFAAVSPHLNPEEQKLYGQILGRTASVEEFQQSLFFLSQLLDRAYNKKAIIIIDEYDTPIVSGFSHNYYAEVVNFLRGLMTTSLKSNTSLSRAYITGISRIAKESIFSDLNNLSVLGLLSDSVSDKFGFTESEMGELLDYYGLADQALAYKEWYDGYRFGKQPSIYNPWSVLECIRNSNEFRPYWGGTSSNAIIKELILRSDANLKQNLEGLLEGRTFVQKIKEGIIYPGIEHDSDAIWNLLLYTGYLTYTEHELKSGTDYCRLAIPNREMMLVYEEVVVDTMKKIIPGPENEIMINALITGEVKLFSKYMQKFLISSLSHFDHDYRAPENSYHMLMLGLTHGLLREVYRAKSNHESGYGRADLLLIPYDTTRPGIAIEFKKVEEDENGADVAAVALQQVREKHYTQELFDLGCHKVYCYGMAFSGKKVEVKMIEQKR